MITMEKKFEKKISPKIEKKVRKDPTKKLQNIYNEEIERTTDRVYPEYRTVKSSLYRARAKKCLQFQGPSEICRLWFMEKTLSGELFPLKNDCENGIVVFTTNENLKMLGECKNVLADGTFKSCPPPFEQLYVLFGNGDRTVPLVFGLLSGKSTFIYQKFFRTTFEKCEI